MVIEASYDRHIKDVVDNLLAYQRDAPIHLRLISPKIHDVQLIEDTLFQKIKRLITHKNALVTMLVNPNGMKSEKEKDYIKQLEEMGVKVHYKRELHAKIILLDNIKERAVLIGSANLTPTGLYKNKEAAVYFLNDQQQVYDRINSYVTHLLKETNENIKGGDYYANIP